ncbi:hypothetical protein AD998_02735 [bacterium 336/3]|nr:hypothetical protein AD998_02735 [bacterium 336/3]
MKSIQQEVISFLKQYYQSSEAETMTFWLLEKLYQVSQTDILMNKKVAESENLIKQKNEYLEKLKYYEPIQYVLGECYFCNRKFEVNASVLIPRPETEELVNYIYEQHQDNTPQKILDVGTGSGCIAISLALNFPSANVTAIDISEKALETAQKNAHNLKARVDFIRTDVLKWQPEDMWDIIVSNPPYIKEDEKNSMRKNVLDYEPHLALFVENNSPLVFYKAIAQIAQKSLNDNGFLYFEINEALGQETVAELEKMYFINIELIKDFYGKNRFVKAQYKSSKFMSK